MIRPLRIEFPGAIYHVTSHGDARASIGNHLGLHYATAGKGVKEAGQSE